MANQLQLAGGQPQKQPKYVPIFMDRAFTGLYTQRAVLHDPSDFVTARYYGGRPDALLGGRNIELTNQLTLKRRPGLVSFGSASATYPTPPLRAFSFQLSNGTIQVIIDTGTSGAMTVTSCNNASAGTTVYNGTFPGGGSNGYVGLTFSIAGFVANPQNNGTYTCTASSSTTLTLSNTIGVAEPHAATATTAGGVYVDNQNGTNTLLFGKGVGAGQSYFVGVAGVLYIGDGVDTKKYTPLNSNGKIWNWGITAPTAQPSLNLTASGSAATVWQANTNFTTMGLTKDTTGTPQIWQLISVNANNSNPNSQFGTAGNGEPNWPTVEGNTVNDGSVVWTNAGAVADWKASSFYTDLGWFGKSPSPSFANPGAIAVASVSAVYGNFKNSGSLGQTGSAANEPKFSGAYPGPSGGYFDNNTHWFAIGSYATSASMAAMRWKKSTPYTVWSTSQTATVQGTPSFVLTNNLPAATGTTVYIMVPTSGGTSYSGYAPFQPNQAIGLTVTDNQLSWLCLGQAAWQANHPYVVWTGQGLPFGCIYDGTNFQVCVTGGTSAAVAPGTSLASAVSITAGNAVGANTTYTLGSGSWAVTPSAGQQVTFSGFTNANDPNNGTFVVVSATSNTIVVQNANGVSETHSASAIITAWATGYGSTTVDGTVLWTCVGGNVAWAAGSATTGIWHLPTNGFQPPSKSQQFGGSQVNGGGFVQSVIASGTSGAGPSQPSWASPTTNDGTIIWQQGSAVSSNSLAWSYGLAYAYSYKAMAATDFYAPTSGGGGGNIPPNGVVMNPFGSGTNAISSASPVYQISGSNTGSVNTVSGAYSPDPQVDTIVIWRSADSASGSGSMFELTEIPNVPSLAGVKMWQFQDWLPSVANATYPGLNILLPAPINGVNNPPPSTFLPQVYNFQRIWGANGQQVNFSGGPDTEVGNSNEAFNAADELPFLAPVVRLVRTPQGIVTFLTDSIEMIQGGPATATFFSTTMAPGIGLASYNACDVFGGEIYFFAADNTFRVLSPSLNMSQYGFPLGDQFANQPVFGSSDATWTPANVYVTVHQNGVDNCVFVSDGSTGWYRMNPHQIPGGAQGPEPIWSPFAAITGGCKLVQSVETSPGIKQLLVGGTGSPATISSRSLTTFSDNGTPYDAYFVMGSITLAHPGQIALLKFLEMDLSGVGFQPTISYLLNEISGTFTKFVNGQNLVPQADPPEVYGATISPTSYSPNRYYFASNAALARCRHMQIKVDYGTNTTGSELYSLTIFGRLMVEL
jgi:hypothetical protein